MPSYKSLLKSRGEGVAGAYSSWYEMHRRVKNPTPDRKNKCYEGVSIHAPWDDFEVFLSDMGERPTAHSIDRVNTDLGYAPANCRWATALTQSRNRNYCKLDEDKARSIRSRYAAGGVSQQKLADEYGVSQVLIGLVVRGKVWAPQPG